MSTQGNGYVAVDLEKMDILFKVPDMHTACLLSALDYLDRAHAIFPVERPFPKEVIPNGGNRNVPAFLSVGERALLYSKLKGEKVTFVNREMFIELQNMLLDLPFSTETLYSLEKRAGPDQLAADLAEIKQRPVYQPVSVPVKSTPSAPIPSAPSAPISTPSADAPWLRAAPSATSAPTPPSAPSPAIPKAPSIPSAPSVPKAGSTTGRVWAIADELYKAEGGTFASLNIDFKALKAKVVVECEAQGINPGTAGTQFGAWKKAQGV